MEFLWYSLGMTSTEQVPTWGSLGCLILCIQTLWSVFTRLYVPAIMALFSALAAAVSHISQAPFQSSFWLFLEEPLSKVAVCMAYIRPTLVGCELIILLICLVLLPYALKGLVTLLVSDHLKISSGIS